MAGGQSDKISEKKFEERANTFRDCEFVSEILHTDCFSRNKQ